MYLHFYSKFFFQYILSLLFPLVHLKSSPLPFPLNFLKEEKLIWGIFNYIFYSKYYDTSKMTNAEKLKVSPTVIYYLLGYKLHVYYLY